MMNLGAGKANCTFKVKTTSSAGRIMPVVCFQLGKLDVSGCYSMFDYFN